MANHAKGSSGRRMRLVTLEQLLEHWYRFPEPITREEIDALEWDELMLSLEISCPDAEGKNIIVSDVDMKTYHNPAVVFTIIRDVE